MQTITDSAEYTKLIAEEKAVLTFLSHEACGVCKVLKPKVEMLINTEFSKIKTVYVNTVELAELAAQLTAFTVPTVLVTFEGKEFLRHSRNLSIAAFRDEIERPYQLLFS